MLALVIALSFECQPPDAKRQTPDASLPAYMFTCLSRWLAASKGESESELANGDAAGSGRSTDSAVRDCFASFVR